MQTSNPILSRIDKDATAAARSSQASAPGAVMAPPTTSAPRPPQAKAGWYDGMTLPAAGPRVTFADVMVKSGILFAIVVVMAIAGWGLASAVPGAAGLVMIVALVGTLVFGIWASVKREASPVLTILYSVCSGFMLGAVSFWYNELAVKQQYQGIVLQAVIATLVTFGVMLLLFGTGIIKVTKRFTQVMIVAMVSYFLIGIASFVAALFGVGGGWGFYGVSGIGILICLFGVGLAAFTLMLDFEAIRQGIAMGLPERESWRMSFGLLVTLVWLYLEFLRMFAIMSRS